MKILILNGPNLNLLGLREPDIYGHKTLDNIRAECTALAGELGAQISTFQNNSEGALVDALHRAREEMDGVIFNPGAYAHTSIALRDAVSTMKQPIIEVHISNIHQREAFRAHSYLSQVVTGMICGLGTDGYLLALRRLVNLLQTSQE